MATNESHFQPPPIDVARLEQILQVQEPLLLGEGLAHDIYGRLCQRTALLLGAAAARLIVRRPDGAREVVAAYGRGEFTAPAETQRDAARPAPAALQTVARDGRVQLSIPVHAGTTSALLEFLSAPAAPFGVEQVALARYAASLAALALRQADVRERLEHADRTKSEVLIVMSHDLRSPLNVLIGYTRLLLDGAYGPCSSEQRDVLTTIERHALELLSLLCGALDLVRLDVDREDLRRERVVLAELVHELCTGSLAHRVAPAVQLDWHVDPALPPLCSDRFRIRQILQNLLDNALRFTTRGSVRVAGVPHAGGVRLTVSDTGPGIAADDLPHLFEVFRPGRSAAGSGAGTGCGLYLVKRFSESLGGRVTVDSTPGVGTRFTLDLPLAPAA